MMRVLHAERAGSSPSPPLERFADLVVGFAANVQPGQIVAIGSEPGKEPLTRAVADAAYRRGREVRRRRRTSTCTSSARGILHAAEDTLDYVPSWYGERILALGDQRCARIGLLGPGRPRGCWTTLDPARAGRDQLPFVRETGKVVNDAHDELDRVPVPDASGGRSSCIPTSTPTPRSRGCGSRSCTCAASTRTTRSRRGPRALDDLIAAASRLTARRFDALHFDGPGHRPARRAAADVDVDGCASFDTVDGIATCRTCPSEEVFTAPDPQRVDGVVRVDQAARLVGGTIVARAAGPVRGRARGADRRRRRTPRSCARYVARDEGAARLGEVALVDRDGRIGPLDTVFYDTLLDENAATHIALGTAYEFLRRGRGQAAAERRARSTSTS